MPRSVNIIRNIDWITILLYLVLVFLGWINIYASIYNEETFKSIFDLSTKYGKQMIFIFFALFIAFVIFLIDNRAYMFFAYFIYGFIIILLIAVLFFGREISGAKSWFDFGLIRFQPSEFAKFATGLALARFLSTFNININKTKDLVIALAIIAVPAFSIILQNDTGSALVYVAFIIVLYRQGLPLSFILLGFLVVLLFVLTLLVHPEVLALVLIVLALIVYFVINNDYKQTLYAVLTIGLFTGLVWSVVYFLEIQLSLYLIVFTGLFLSSFVFLFYAYRKKIISAYFIVPVLVGALVYIYSVDYIFDNVLEKHHRTRINILLGVQEDIHGAGYNVHQSKIAIGSGGFSGKGFLQGTQTKGDFVPEQSTDFIFCTVGEEWGFIGTSLTITLFIALLIRLIYLAERQRSVFSRAYGYAVLAILFFHLVVNIGMTIGLSPVIGIPLPFFSYGGSSLWGFTILLFIFLRLDVSRLELL